MEHSVRIELIDSQADLHANPEAPLLVLFMLCFARVPPENAIQNKRVQTEMVRLFHYYPSLSLRKQLLINNIVFK